LTASSGDWARLSRSWALQDPLVGLDSSSSATLQPPFQVLALLEAVLVHVAGTGLRGHESAGGTWRLPASGSFRPDRCSAALADRFPLQGRPDAADVLPQSAWFSASPCAISASMCWFFSSMAWRAHLQFAAFTGQAFDFCAQVSVVFPTGRWWRWNVVFLRFLSAIAWFCASDRGLMSSTAASSLFSSVVCARSASRSCWAALRFIDLAREGSGSDAGQPDIQLRPGLVICLNSSALRAWRWRLSICRLIFRMNVGHPPAGSGGSFNLRSASALCWLVARDAGSFLDEIAAFLRTGFGYNTDVALLDDG